MAEAYNNYCTSLGTTGNTTIYTGITGTAILNGIHVSNTDPSNSASITIKLFKGATGYSIITGALVPIQSSYQALDTPIPLVTGDSLKATASAANRLDVIVSVLEST